MYQLIPFPLPAAMLTYVLKIDLLVFFLIFYIIISQSKCQAIFLRHILLARSLTEDPITTDRLTVSVYFETLSLVFSKNNLQTVNSNGSILSSSISFNSRAVIHNTLS